MDKIRIGTASPEFFHSYRHSVAPVRIRYRDKHNPVQRIPHGFQFRPWLSREILSRLKDRYHVDYADNSFQFEAMHGRDGHIHLLPAVRSSVCSYPVYAGCTGICSRTTAGTRCPVSDGIYRTPSGRMSEKLHFSLVHIVQNIVIDLRCGGYPIRRDRFRLRKIFLRDIEFVRRVRCACSRHKKGQDCQYPNKSIHMSYKFILHQYCIRNRPSCRKSA